MRELSITEKCKRLGGLPPAKRDSVTQLLRVKAHQ